MLTSVRRILLCLSLALAGSTYADEISGSSVEATKAGITAVAGVADNEIATVGMHQLLPMMTRMKGTTPGQWRITWTGDPSTEAKISWNTIAAGNVHRIHYDTEPRGTDIAAYRFKATPYKSGKFRANVNHEEEVEDKSSIGHFHHVDLKGLQPDTRYYFIIESDGEFTRPLYFITAPRGNQDFSLLNGGDSRSGHLERCRMNLRMAKLVENNPEILALAHGGDYVYNGQIWAHWRHWFSHNELMTCADGRVIPIIPARGNHEEHPMYNDAFDPPEWHTTALPWDSTLVTLSSNRASRGNQLEWFQTTMDEVGPQSRWLMTMYHLPIYPGVKGTPRHKSAWAGVMDKHYVDLALEADGHIIKRTKPIRDDKEHKDGVIYIGEGGLGVGSRAPQMDRWWMDKGGRGSHVFLLDFTEDKLRCRVIMKDGSTWDDTTIDNKSHLRHFEKSAIEQ